VPALPGCAAHGSSPEKAAKEAVVAAEAILQAMMANDDSVPPEDSAADFSGQLRLRLPRSLHERLARLATAEGVSLNQELVALLASGTGQREIAKTRRRVAGKGR
jgi:predicted HicB family RNase H-like nuclease